VYAFWERGNGKGVNDEVNGGESENDGANENGDELGYVFHGMGICGEGIFCLL